MRGKLTESVRLLKELKDQKETAEQQGKNHEVELRRVREELEAR